MPVSLWEESLVISQKIVAIIGGHEHWILSDPSILLYPNNLVSVAAPLGGNFSR